jgi:hypothetical protein
MFGKFSGGELNVHPFLDPFDELGPPEGDAFAYIGYASSFDVRFRKREIFFALNRATLATTPKVASKVLW